MNLQNDEPVILPWLDRFGPSVLPCCVYIYVVQYRHSPWMEGDELSTHHQNNQNWNNFGCEPFHDH